MKDKGKMNNKANDKANGNSSGPMLRFNYIKREALPQTRIDVRALEMVRGYPVYVKELTDHEPPIGEVLEQCIIKTLSDDADFIEWLSHQPRPESIEEQNNTSTSAQRESSIAE